MGKIRVLDEGTINQIAAGEVIEHPASVVKELVENSLDADSTEIAVEILSGGRELIRVTDNGCGMSRDDAVLCLERHATSKIRRLDDIYATSTMGFRGEAMPSIASISKFTLITCPQEGNVTEATMILVEGGKILKCCAAARSPGTTIEVKSLFFNVPVRRKFQKSPAYDQTEIVKMMSRLALGHPRIKLQLIADGNTLLSTQPDAHASQEAAIATRIQEVLGKEFFTGLSPLSLTVGDISVTGYVSSPHSHRPNRTGQYLFVNNRAVVSPLVSQAVRDGYGMTLPQNRYPLFVLYLTVPGDLVDVNVHPQKHEVRIRNENALKEAVLKAVEQALQRRSAPISTPVLPPMRTESSWSPHRMGSMPIQERVISLSAPRQPVEEALAPPVPILEPPSPKVEEKTFVAPPPPAPAREIRVLATLPRYILGDIGTTDAQELLLIDQRAAHTRILFESLQDNASETIPIQALLVPITLALPSNEATLIQSYLEPLNRMGISMREFGVNTFLIDALPQLFVNKDVVSFIHEIVRELREGMNSRLYQKEKAESLATAASRAALPTEKRLSLTEAQSLVQQLMRCRQPLECPRGRPTLSPLNPETLAGLFQGPL